MADILTISNNNYILQGTVNTSAGIIGDGSSQNPIRTDETVLFSGSHAITATGQLDTLDNPYNYSKIEIWAAPYPGYVSTIAATFEPSTGSTKVPFNSVGINDSVLAIRFNISLITTNTSGISIVNQRQYSITGTSPLGLTTASSPAAITKIVGIGYKGQ
jgi:hypothetical protein